MSKKIADLCGEVTDAIEEDKLDPATTTALRLHSDPTLLDTAARAAAGDEAVDAALAAHAARRP